MPTVCARFGACQTDGNQRAVRKVSACPNPYNWHVAESDIFFPSVFISFLETRNSTIIHKRYKVMNTISKLTLNWFHMLTIRMGLIKAIAIIPVTKHNHMMSGLKSLLFIQIIPAFTVSVRNLDPGFHG
jgi:hypothetical protein